MKNYLIFLLWLLYITVNAQVSILNPDFETPDNSLSSGQLGWKYNTSFKLSTDQQVRHGGSASLKMQSVEGTNFGAFSQLIKLPPSKTLYKITLSGFIKREAVEGFTGFWINVFAGDQSIGFDNMASQQLAGTHDWLAVKTSVIADETATDINMGGLLVGTGTVWFDDISVTISPLANTLLPDSLRSYLTESLDIMQKKALYRDSVNWPVLRQKALAIASEAVNYKDCYPAINYALSQLGDHHSFLMPADQAQKWENASSDLANMPQAPGKMLEHGIAYIMMPGVSSGDQKANAQFATNLQNLLEQLDQNKPKGWVFDLRQNTGGNCWPMLAGIGPLLGEGVCGYFISPGNSKSAWFYKNGASGVQREKITRISRKPVKLQQKMPKVAVITGPNTGSSGEVVTVAFRGRPNCRSFGQATYGLSTGNEDVKLRDGAKIFLTSSIYADRNKVAYGSKIQPDVLVEPGVGDPALQKAVLWLSGGQ